MVVAVGGVCTGEATDKLSGRKGRGALPTPICPSKPELCCDHQLMTRPSPPPVGPLPAPSPLLLRSQQEGDRKIVWL